jgi:subtilisin family serine protease
MRRWKQEHPDLLLVAAAGNDGLKNHPWYPAGFAALSEFADWVVSVGAHDENRTQAAFSNHGDWVKAWAPGVGVHSHYPKAKRFRSADGAVASFPDGFATWSGTSFAAPYALAAILREAETKGLDPLAVWRDLSSRGLPVTFP